jgi:hypothetical protein
VEWICVLFDGPGDGLKKKYAMDANSCSCGRTSRGCKSWVFRAFLTIAIILTKYLADVWDEDGLCELGWPRASEWDARGLLVCLRAWAEIGSFARRASLSCRI